MRIGYGEDIHRLVENRKLVLGGVTISFELGLLGHSDADVVIHSLCDAILGAMGDRDIGYYFSDKDPKYEGINSLLILDEVNKMMNENGYSIGNIDISIACEKPHLNDYIPEMKKIISSRLSIDVSKIGIKAMTNEKLDSVGEGKAIRSVCVVLLEEGK